MIDPASFLLHIPNPEKEWDEVTHTYVKSDRYTPEQLRVYATACIANSLTYHEKVLRECKDQADQYLIENGRLKEKLQAKSGYVLVKAYKECHMYADDNPGLRAECSRKIASKDPCEKCPMRAIQNQLEKS